MGELSFWPRSRQSRAALVWILVLAAAVRIAPIALHRFAPQQVFALDSQAYLVLGRALVETGRLERPGMRLEVAGELPNRLENPLATETFRTPGYPLLTGAVESVFGRRAAPLIWLQIVLGLAVVAACYLLGRRLIGHRVAALGAGLLSLDVGHVVYANMVMSDVPFAAAVAAGFVLAARAAGPRAAPAALGAGLLLSLATSIRPVGALLFVPLGGWLWARSGRPLLVLWLALGAMLFPTAWTLRNWAATGVPMLSTASYFNLYLFSAAKVKARGEGLSRQVAFRELGEAIDARLPEDDTRGWIEAYRDVGGAVYRAAPGAALWEAGISLAEMTLAPERRNLLRILGHPHGSDGVGAIGEGERSAAAVLGYLGGLKPFELAIVAAQLVWNAACWCLALVGTVHLWRSRQEAEAGLVTGVLGYHFLVSLMVSSARMRAPIAFLWYLLAANGLVCLWRRLRPAGRGAGP